MTNDQVPMTNDQCGLAIDWSLVLGHWCLTLFYDAFFRSPSRSLPTTRLNF
jgi:hypothetical protein